MGDISSNFSKYEFACKCGCGYDDIDVRLMPIAEAIRHLEGDRPLTPSSGCRCVNHNEVVQKARNRNYVPFSSRSKHMEGLAMDILSLDPQRLYDFLDNLFPNIYGIGVYSWGIHIDTRPKKARWGYTTHSSKGSI